MTKRKPKFKPFDLAVSSHELDSPIWRIVAVEGPRVAVVDAMLEHKRKLEPSWTDASIFLKPLPWQGYMPAMRRCLDERNPQDAANLIASVPAPMQHHAMDAARTVGFRVEFYVDGVRVYLPS